MKSLKLTGTILIARLKFGLENAASEQSTIVNTLEREVATMKKDIATLKARNEDLENSMKEGRENGEGPVSYISRILESLKLDKAPLLDRAHRDVRASADQEGEPSSPQRAFVVGCHYYQEKVAILQKAAGKLLKTEDNDGILIFPNYSLEVSRQWAKQCEKNAT